MGLTIKQILTDTKIDQLDAQLLLAHVIKKSREFVIANSDHLITRSLYHQITKLFTQRAQGIPLAYLTGHKEFFGLDFVVNKAVLIPRPETEILVEYVINKIRNQKTENRNLKLVDVGTGSGCIPISIAKTMDQWINGSIQFYATDISKKALKTAKQNAKEYGIKIKFFQGNLLDPIINNSTIDQWHNGSIIITANLPYLTEEQFKNEPSIQHEPKQALVAKKDGLALYEQLLKQIKQIVTCYVVCVTCFMEIDPSQTNQIRALIQTYLPTAKIQIKKDLAGRDRVVCIEVENN